MMWSLVIFVVWTLFSTNAGICAWRQLIWIVLAIFIFTGQLVRVGTACSSAQSVYTCSREADVLRWDFERNGVNRARVLVAAEFNTAGDIFDRVIESVTVYFNVTSANSFVSVTATINDTSLNGIRMNCTGETLDITVLRPSKLLHFQHNLHL